jgi:hypothetical protein
MTLSRDILWQFVDGELSPQDASRVAAELVKDAQARAFVDEQIKLRQTLKSAFVPAMEDRVPDRLRSAVAEAPVSIRFRIRQMLSRRGFATATLLPAAGALAMGLVLGMILVPSQTGPLAAQDGALFAQGNLAKALTVQLAASAPSTDAPQIGLSFRSKNGHICRTFAMDRLAGIACRSQTRWQIAAVAQAEPQTGATYRMAASTMPDSIRDAAIQMMAGTPFTAAQERQARARGWQ